MRTIFSSVFLALCIAGASGSVLAQKTWEKPLDKWSKEDALKVVSESPWAQTFQSRESVTLSGQGKVAREQADTVNNGGGNTAGSSSRYLGNPPIVVRLHSGMPIRQALVRGRQLAANYSKMDDAKKAEFDKQNEGFLACAICQKYYVISVTQLPDSSTQGVEQGIFQRITLKDIAGGVFLVNDKGEERPLVQLNPSKGVGDSAYLFFARKDANGKDLVTTGDKTVTLTFRTNFFASSNPYAGLFPRYFEFKVPKLMNGDKLDF